MICTVIRGPSAGDVRQQIRLATPYASMLELRLDLFESYNETFLEALKKECRLPMIFTLRAKSHGGTFSGTEQERLALLKRLAILQPEYLDIECDVPKLFFQEIAKDHPHLKIICSYHNYESTPKDLPKLYLELKSKPAYLYKIAVMSKNTCDAMRLLCWAKDAGNDIIAVGMGPCGQITRILSPLVGGHITYAAVDETQAISGQLEGRILRERYRYNFLNRSTKAYGLIGDPVYGSPSDLTHNRRFAELNANCVYVKMTVTPDELPQFLEYAKNLPFHGLSVTMPLKEVVMAHLDTIDSEAKEIGAVNTLVKSKNEFSGYNTDGKGALNALEALKSVKGKRIALVGAGGAAKAIAYEAIRRGALVTIVNRDKAKAEMLAKKVGAKSGTLPTTYDILINATPVPIDPSHIIPEAIVMDIKSSSTLSDLLKHAHKKQCPVVPAYNMFVQQAHDQFRLWEMSEGLNELQDKREK